MKSENSSQGMSVSDQRAYYNKYWATHKNRLNSHEILRLAKIIEAYGNIVPYLPNREIRICDLGCGRGWLSGELTKFGKVTGVDLSTEAIQVAQERWPEVHFRAENILEWRPSEVFDVVVSSEVLEHVPDHERFATTVRHLLREGGVLILTTPNGQVKSAWDAGNMGQQLIENWVTRKGLRTLFRGFEVSSHTVFILDFSYGGIFRWLCAPKLHALLRLVGLMSLFDLVRRGLGLGLYQILVARIDRST